MSGFQFAGKIALITGGAGGIGLATAQEFFKNGIAGVSLVDIKTSEGVDKLKKQFGVDKVIFIQVDLTDKKQLENAFEDTVKHFGHLDIVFNNAGIVNEVDWELTLAVNLEAVIRGSLLAINKYLPRYKSGPEGIVINTSSMWGVEATEAHPVYCATKSALVNFGRSLGGDEYYKKHQVRVLTILPGLTETPMLDTPKEKVPMVDLAWKAMEGLVSQSAEYVGRAVVDAILVGGNGSLWVTEEKNPAYEIGIPSRKELAVKK